MRKRDFILHAANLVVLLLKKNYNERKIWAKINNFVNRKPFIYGMSHTKHIIDSIRHNDKILMEDTFQ